MITQFVVCLVATLSFAILFSAPKKQLLLCGFTGAFGWIVYLACIEKGIGSSIANLIATFALTVIARTIAAIRKNPVTIYLVAGIFPLVPGAGIYYTSYYFIMNEMSEFTRSAADTVKVAGAIALGIILGFAIPQHLFSTLQKITTRPTNQKTATK